MQLGNIVKKHETSVAGAYLIELTLRSDERGFFARTFCAQSFRDWGLEDVFVQTNCSRSHKRGTIRGLHYQLPPAAEAKLVRCTRGKIQDVLVDLRRDSPTFLQAHQEVISDSDHRMVYVPAGCAHGYQSLEDGCEITYQASAFYTPNLERCVRYDDPRFHIRWLVPEVIVSPKDAGIPDLPSDFSGILL